MEIKIELGRNRGWIHFDLNRPREMHDLVDLMLESDDCDFDMTDAALVCNQFRKALTLYRCGVVARRLAEYFLIERTPEQVYWAVLEHVDSDVAAQLQVYTYFLNYHGELCYLAKQIGGEA